MNKNTPIIKVNKKLHWLTRPKPGHLVQYYKSEEGLLSPLADFIGTGIRTGDTCIVIATAPHIQRLNSLLIDQGIRVDEASADGYYISINASDLLAKFMVNGLPDKVLFYKEIGRILQIAYDNNTPIRAFGEMVALLWRVGNKEAVINLEKLWNELAKQYEFSLYCAYPDLHFVMDSEARQEISHCHNLHYPAFSPA